MISSRIVARTRWYDVGQVPTPGHGGCKRSVDAAVVLTVIYSCVDLYHHYVY